MSLRLRSPRTTAIAAAIGGVLLAMSPLTAPLLAASPNPAASPTTCRPSQLIPSMSPPRGTYSSSAGFRATLWFKNTGATCAPVVDNVPVQAVNGPSHRPVGISSLSGTVAYPMMVLGHGDFVYATVSIGSISTAQFKELVRVHGSSCSPKYANGIEVLANPRVASDSWLSHYFALPERVPVCTQDYFNVSAGVIEESPVGFIKGRLEASGGPGNTSGYRPYPGMVWATAKGGELFGATVPASGYFEFRVPVGTYQLTGSSPLYGGGSYRCRGSIPTIVRTRVFADENVICTEK
ncbi:MAG: hypothetical protein HKL85_06850 [Acidimicrobiaceae bacterium]|nr:hypothetical protein [Acidimicrobiaceae bacterium]